MENSVAKIERVLQTVIAEQRRMRVREQVSRDSKYYHAPAHIPFAILPLSLTSYDVHVYVDRCALVVTLFVNYNTHTLTL